MVRYRLAGAWGAPAVGIKPDGRLRPILSSEPRAHCKKKLGLAWAGACTSLRSTLDRLRLALGFGSMRYRCPLTSQQSVSRGTLRQRDDEDREEESQTRRTRLEETSQVPLEGFAAKVASISRVDDEDGLEEKMALARAAAAAAVPATKYDAAEGDSMESRVLYITAKQKGMLTKEDVMRGIAAATRDADFEACLSWLPPKVKGGKTVFLLQVPKEHVEAIKSHKWDLIEVFTEQEIKQRSSFLTGELDVTVLRFPSTSFPFEKGGGIKWDSPAFMQESACRLVRDMPGSRRHRNPDTLTLTPMESFLLG